jgi:ankyrin repeat protein
MKSQLIAIVAAVLMVGCCTPAPEPPPAKAPDISINQAVFDGNIEAVKQHLAAGADVNAKDDNGWIPLHFAVYYGHKEIAELLIVEGADVNAKTKDNTTPLDLAIEYNQTETADLLHKHGGKTGEELTAISS